MPASTTQTVEIHVAHPEPRAHMVKIVTTIAIAVLLINIELDLALKGAICVACGLWCCCLRRPSSPS